MVVHLVSVKFGSNVYEQWIILEVKNFGRSVKDSLGSIANRKRIN